MKYMKLRKLLKEFADYRDLSIKEVDTEKGVTVLKEQCVKSELSLGFVKKYGNYKVLYITCPFNRFDKKSSFFTHIYIRAKKE